MGRPVAIILGLLGIILLAQMIATVIRFIALVILVIFTLGLALKWYRDNKSPDRAGGDGSP
jgi:phage-related minor tail protein